MGVVRSTLVLSERGGDMMLFVAATAKSSGVALVAFVVAVGTDAVGVPSNAANSASRSATDPGFGRAGSASL